MTEANGAPARHAEAPQIRMQVLAQFVRDLSFENVVVQKGLQGGEVQPDVQVPVSLDARKRPADHQYEVITKFKVTSKNKASGDTLFLLELEYGGIFHVEGVPDEQLHPFLLIECPRMLFPFVRRIISDVTRDGGFPPLNVDKVDFLALYRQELARRLRKRRRRQSRSRSPDRSAPFRPDRAVAQCLPRRQHGRRLLLGCQPRRQRVGPRARTPVGWRRRAVCRLRCRGVSTRSGCRPPISSR